MQKKRWWIPLMILACLLWAVSCAQKGAEEVMGIGVRPAASDLDIPAVVEEAEDERNKTDEERPERPPHGMIPFVVRGEGGELTECSRPPKLTVAGCADAVHPSCTWTADGATMIACGMGTLDLVTAGLVESVPRDLADVPAPELLFEVEPDRVTVRAALLRWDENGELLTSYDDFYEIRIDEEYRDYLVTREDSVVEITAEWDERDGFGGHALYVFRVGGEPGQAE